MSITKKQKISIIITSLLLFLIGLFYFSRDKLRQNFNLDVSSLLIFESAEERVIREKSNQENKAYVAKQAVMTQKNLESCKLLREKDKDSCYLDIANSNDDKKICELISKQAIHDSCLENFALKEALGDKNVKSCYNLASTTKDDCLSDYFRNFSNVKDCTAVEGVDRQKCLDLVNNAQAYKLGDSNLCNLVVDDVMRENCKKVIKNVPLDSDKDGLSDSDERSFGTNPSDVDTDNDSLSDYDEIFKYKTNPLENDSKDNSVNNGV